MSPEFKVYLLKDGYEIMANNLPTSFQEIRRFIWEETSNKFDYKKFCKRVFASFGNDLQSEYGKDATIKTYWLDEENDLVAFSTDDELKEVISMVENTNGLVKVNLMQHYILLCRLVDYLF